MSTFASTTVGITLTLTSQNPATIVAGAYVTNNTTLQSGDAVYGSTAAAWNISNYGTIKATGANSSGVRLENGGTVTNVAGAQISGLADGVVIAGGTGSISNSGTIRGTGTAGYGI